MNVIGKDIALLQEFNLMDYSLFLVVEYNPRYVESYPEEFLRGPGGATIFPVQEVALPAHDPNEDRVKSQVLQEKDKKEFMDSMASETIDKFLTKLNIIMRNNLDNNGEVNELVE
mmetsp:Transcript_15910/g.26815  ORF Transcript_15910/g.26815 Transcript_15910/m.26815 type:complete len:115 (+) Transcript_15910:324-668(+)